MKFRLTLCLIIAFIAPSTYVYAAPHERDFAVLNEWQWTGAGGRLSWNQDANASEYKVYRRVVNNNGPAPSAPNWNWNLIATLPGNSTTHTDSSAVAHTLYEYAITKTISIEGSTYQGHGFMYAGHEIELPTTRGKVLLLVEEELDQALAAEIDQYKLALVGDLWEVIHRTAQRHGISSHQDVKQIIQEEYDRDPQNLKSVILFGSLPKVQSGVIAPDGHHYDHMGAWSSLAYYQDVYPPNAASRWTDTGNFRTTNANNTNVANDGRWDISGVDQLPDGSLMADLEIGLIDLSNLPAFSESETALYRRYLAEKAIPFRNKTFSVDRTAITHAGFVWNAGRIPSVSGWRDFGPLVGRDGLCIVDETIPGQAPCDKSFWSLYNSDTTAFWALVSSTGSTEHIWGYENTSQLASGRAYKAISILTHGSWHGDFHINSNNINRAFLAAEGYVQASLWTGRPHSMFYPAGMGLTLGYGAKKGLNSGQDEFFNSRGYDENVHQVHFALMGDPTLRMNIIEPISNLSASTEGVNVTLSWDGVSSSRGYLVYRGTEKFGPYTQLTPELISATSFTDTSVINDEVFYSVVSVELQNSPTGSYFNNSTGQVIPVSIPNVPEPASPPPAFEVR